MTNAIINNVSDLSDTEIARLKSFTSRVVSSSNITSISNLIEVFKSSVIDQYFDVNQGEIILKYATLSREVMTQS